MKKMIQKATTWLMIACMMIGVMPIFGSAAAMEAQSPACADEQASAVVSAAGQYADRSDEDNSGKLEDMSPESSGSFLWDLLKAIGENLRKVSVDDVLNLPAGVMDDVVTYIFAAFKLLGLNIDSFYNILSALFVVK